MVKVPRRLPAMALSARLTAAAAGSIRKVWGRGSPEVKPEKESREPISLLASQFADLDDRPPQLRAIPKSISARKAYSPFFDSFIALYTN
jgi:hypothetical protein